MKPFRFLSIAAFLIVVLVAVVAASARADAGSAPETSAVITSADTILEYELPVLPFQLIVKPNGTVWFNAATGRSLGRLDPALGQLIKQRTQE